MAETEQILYALKRRMRARGVTYRDAATALGLSEVSVKRLFAERSFSLLRLEKLCQLVDIDLGGLVRLAEEALPQQDRLSLEQEQALVSDTGLLLVAVCLINHFSFADILHKYRFEQHELIRLFVKLDRLGVIELLPGNHYRMKLSRHFHLQPSGPVQTFFINKLLKEFILGNSPGEQAPFQLAWGMLSRSSIQELQNRIQRLIEDYLQIAEHDRRLPVGEKLTSSLFIMFHENLEPDLFRQYWKQSK